MRFRGSSWRKVALYLGFACLLVAALRRPSETARPSAERPDSPNLSAPRRRENEKGSILARSIGLLFVATLVFALGAALGGAFAASADDGTPVDVGSVSTATDEATTSPDTSTEPVTSDETTTSPQPEPTTTVVETTPPPGSSTQPVPTAGGSSSAHHHSVSPTPAAPSGPQHTKRPHPHRELTIWVHRTLPDPIPPARRLSSRFATLLRTTAQAHEIHWWPVLAILRAQGRDGRAPAGAARLERLARRIANHAIRLDAETHSLARYNRAVGLRALVVGLEAAKPSLERRILRNSQIGLSSAAVGDIVAGRVDVRVLVVIRYLAVTFHQVTVSCLITGHRFFARRKVMSGHVDGLAVDVSSIRGIPIAGNQGIGGIAERTIEALLRLPAEVRPQQIISLLGLGGPSFPQGDHYDHIHVGY
jgi:hypothetical protein